MNALQKVREALARALCPTAIVVSHDIWMELTTNHLEHIQKMPGPDLDLLMGFPCAIIEGKQTKIEVTIVEHPVAEVLAAQKHPFKRAEFAKFPQDLSFMLAMTFTDAFTVTLGDLKYVRVNGEWFLKVSPSKQTFLQFNFNPETMQE